MEIMARPSQEVLTFSKVVRRWIIADETVSGKKKFIFREDIPDDILKLYKKIKPKLDFAY